MARKAGDSLTVTTFYSRKPSFCSVIVNAPIDWQQEAGGRNRRQDRPSSEKGKTVQYIEYHLYGCQRVCRSLTSKSMSETKTSLGKSILIF